MHIFPFGLKERNMRKFVLISVALVISAAVLGCSKRDFYTEASTDYYSAMLGPVADCEYSVLTFKMPDDSLRELNINGLPTRGFWGAELICQSCNDPANWKVLRRRGVSLAVIFEAAGIDLPDSTPINFIGRDGWDPWRTVLGCNPDKLMTFGYLREHAYIYVGSPGLKDPSLPVDAPGNFAKDPLYPAMEGKSLCLDFDFEDILAAQATASVGGMEVLPEGCFGQYRYSMLEKYSETMFGIIEIDPQP
jgi:hypothetical protein